MTSSFVLTDWILCKLFRGHLCVWDHHGPPIQDLAGPWYRCLRCGGLVHYPKHVVLERRELGYVSPNRLSLLMRDGI